MTTSKVPPNVAPTLPYTIDGRVRGVGYAVPAWYPSRNPVSPDGV